MKDLEPVIVEILSRRLSKRKKAHLILMAFADDLRKDIYSKHHIAPPTGSKWIERTTPGLPLKRGDAEDIRTEDW